MEQAVRDIVIVGGGTAGWLTAAVLAAAPDDGLRPRPNVTVVESPDVAPIGVGEGTWPSMRDTLRGIGVSEADFFRECDASFKQGSRFDGWRSGALEEHYRHPFTLPHGHLDADLVAGWLQERSGLPFADAVTPQARLCAASRAPKQATTPEFAGVVNYGYHLDAGRFGGFLRTHATTRLGVRHVADHVEGVESHASGDIASLRLRSGDTLAGDLFVDCSGLQALLLGGHYQVPFISQRHVLFNDSALALQVPHAQPDTELACDTRASAQEHGWIWDIGLPTRRGIGHVYSSAHTDDEAAEQALRAYVARNGGPLDPPAARKLTFMPGYRERFWHRNCVAIGLSAGFIEPLEASAIALVEMSAAMLRDQMPATRDDMDQVGARFNDAFAYRWGRVIEFLKLHYVLSERRDTAFWRDHVEPASIPDRLVAQLDRWRFRAPSRYDLDRADEVFPSASYQYVLYGMGFRPDTCMSSTRATHAAQARFREVEQLAARMRPALPGHRELVSHIGLHGLPRI